MTCSRSRVPIVACSTAGARAGVAFGSWIVGNVSGALYETPIDGKEMWMRLIGREEEGQVGRSECVCLCDFWCVCVIFGLCVRDV